jgi:pyridoxine/pyridoxamine 5'-phosphate oxidase
MNKNKESLSSAWEHLKRYPVCNLATVDISGEPDNRVMGYVPMFIDDQVGPGKGIVFVMNTDAGSRKTHQLDRNPNVSITVGQEWPTRVEPAPYVRLKGQAKMINNRDLDKELRETYFQQYPEAKRLFEEPERTPTVMIIAVIRLLEYIADPSINPPEGIEAFSFDEL